MLESCFVGAPWSDTRNPCCNGEQVAYFGITPEQSLAAGKAAKQFVYDQLTAKKFMVFT